MTTANILFSPGKPEPTRSPFDQEVRRDKRNLLKSNLEKLDIPAAKVDEILEMRGRLPDRYDEMPLKAPSRCFSIFENNSIPKKSWLTAHRVDIFKRCADELLDGLTGDDPIRERPGPGI